MSRHSVVADVKIHGVLLNSVSVAYGFDHACGYFIQAVDPNDPDKLVYNEDSMFTGLTGGGMLDAFEEMGIYDRIPQHHKRAAALDLPIVE